MGFLQVFLLRPIQELMLGFPPEYLLGFLHKHFFRYSTRIFIYSLRSILKKSSRDLSKSFSRDFPRILQGLCIWISLVIVNEKYPSKEILEFHLMISPEISLRFPSEFSLPNFPLGFLQNFLFFLGFGQESIMGFLLEIMLGFHQVFLLGSFQEFMLGFPQE